MNDFPDYKLVRTHRRSIALQVTPQGKLVVRAPVFMSAGQIRSFISGHVDWIRKQLEKARKPVALPRNRYNTSHELLYLGMPYRLEIGNFKEIAVTDKIQFPDFLTFRIKKELEEWYRRKAKEIITDRVTHYATLLDVRYHSITFSDTSSKWGSCTADNRLQFNWKLIMSPILVIDYVVVHELAHTLEKNHSRSFWKIVEYHKPAYRQYKKWLNDNAHRMVI